MPDPSAELAPTGHEAAIPLARILEWSTEALVYVAPAGTITWASPGVGRLIGGHEPLVGRELTSLVHPDDDLEIQRLAETLSGGNGSATVHCRMRNGDGGQWRRVALALHDGRKDSELAGFVGVLTDAPLPGTDESNLRDPLTGLATRHLFRDRLAHAVSRSHRDPMNFAVLLLDVVRFHHINDTMGHQAGDELLRAVAALLRAHLRESDTAARMGDDEFAVLIEDLDAPGHASDVAERLVGALSEPVWLAGEAVNVDVSIGIVANDAEGPASVDEVTDALIRDATLAMQRARKAGPGRYVTFLREHHDDAIQRIEMEAGLSEALRNHQFVLHYQPIVALTDGSIVGLEALVRWHHPELGLISPNDFIPVAEETGLIVQIGAWVAREATRQVAEWQRRFPSNDRLSVSVNVSPIQFRRGDVVRDVAAALTLSGLEPEDLTLEITESTLIDDVDVVADVMRRLKQLGVRLALDDFGTGYSSLAHLHNFPFDVLKIDRAFIRDADDDKRAELARAIIDLGRTLDLVTVAEGIEKSEQLQRFRALSATYGQGYLFSRPGRGVEIEALLAARSRSLRYLG